MKGCIWMTGLSGSGKSTIAERVKKILPDIVVLDGDVLRQGLCSDLGFSEKDRRENMRRLREICKLFVNNGKTVITAFISPYEDERKRARHEIPNCKIVYINASLEKCEERDVKGLYAKARSGEIKEFTGVSAPFEPPDYDSCYDLRISTDDLTIDESVSMIIGLLNE